MRLNYRDGFTLVEVIVYTAIFAASAAFLVAILGVVTRIQGRQSSVNEINNQISFANNIIRRTVEQSSLIENSAGSPPTSTLALRMSSSSIDKTLIYSSGTVLYLREFDQNGVEQRMVALTDSNVRVDNFSVTKYDNPGGQSLVRVTLTMSYNSQNPQTQATRTIQTAVSRISAASFDSDLLPDLGNIRNIGLSSNKWQNGYFGGNVFVDTNAKISNNLGVGTDWSSTNTAKIKSAGDIVFSSSSYGLVLMAPNGLSCFRLTIGNNGAFVTSTSFACP